MRCFSSPGSLSAPMYSARNDPMGRVSPFGNPRIKICSQFPEAYRRVPRPSSPFGAKASTKCPLTLDRSAVTHRGKPRIRDNSVKTRLMSARTIVLDLTTGQTIDPADRDDTIFTMSKSSERAHFSKRRNRTPSRKKTTLHSQFLAHVRSPKRYRETGGGERARTVDLLLAKQALSQLSYTPGPRTSGSIKQTFYPLFLSPRIPDSQKWWAGEDLNLRPHAYQARALTN